VLVFYELIDEGIVGEIYERLVIKVIIIEFIG